MSVLTWLLICTGWGWITYKVGYAVGAQDGYQQGWRAGIK